MAKIFTKLADKFPRWILLENDKIVKDEKENIKEFRTIEEIEFYIDVHFAEGLVFRFYKYYGIFD